MKSAIVFPEKEFLISLIEVTTMTLKKIHVWILKNHSYILTSHVKNKKVVKYESLN